MNFSKRISSLLLAASFICISLFSFNSNADSTKIYEDENMVMFEEKMNFSNITNSLNQVSDLLENNPFIESKIAISICTLFVLPAKISELDLKYMSRLGLAYSF